MSPNGLPILIVHPDQGTRDSLADVLGEQNFSVLVASDFKSGAKIQRASRPWLVLAELQFGGPLGEDFASSVASEKTSHVLCLSSQRADPRSVSRAMNAGASEVFEYPRDVDELLLTIDQLANSRRGMASRVDDSVVTLDGIRAEAKVSQRRRLTQVLQECGGNISLTAERLGCSRATVHRQIKRFGIDRDRSSAPQPEFVEKEARDSPVDSAGASSAHEAAAPPHADVPTVLVAEDLDHKRAEIGRSLAEAGLAVRFAPDGQAAWELFQLGNCDCVITDFKMPRMDGIALIEHIRASGSDVPVFLLSGFADVALAVTAMKRGAHQVFRYEDLDLPVFAAQVAQASAAYVHDLRGH